MNNNGLVPVHRTQRVNLVQLGPITPIVLRGQFHLLEGDQNRAQQINAAIQERGLAGPLTNEAVNILRNVLPGTEEEKEARINQYIQQLGLQG